MLRIALPKGRLLTHSYSLLSKLDLEPSRDSRAYRISVERLGWEVLFLKTRDIPDVVSRGLVDVGIAPDEWIAETPGRLVRLTTLCWCHARICLLGHGDTAQLVVAGQPVLGPVHVATEFPHLARSFLSSRPGEFSILEVHGATEAYLPNPADLVIDCVETGRTLEENGLVILEEIMRSDVHLLTSRGALEGPAKTEIAAFARLVSEEGSRAASECDWRTEAAAFPD